MPMLPILPCQCRSLKQNAYAKTKELRQNVSDPITNAKDITKILYTTRQDNTNAIPTSQTTP